MSLIFKTINSNSNKIAYIDNIICSSDEEIQNCLMSTNEYIEFFLYEDFDWKKYFNVDNDNQYNGGDFGHFNTWNEFNKNRVCFSCSIGIHANDPHDDLEYEVEGYVEYNKKEQQVELFFSSLKKIDLDFD